MSYNVGINVVEVDGRATPSIQPAPTSVAGFIIRAQRGVPKKVYPVTNWREFTEAFGSYMDTVYGAYAVKGFFDNGGSMAHILRVAKVPENDEDVSPNTATPAHLSLGDLDLFAGYRGNKDPGNWGRKIGVSVTENRNNNTGENVPVERFDLLVEYDGKLVETWEDLNLNFADPNQKGFDPSKVINDEFSGSKYITVGVNGTANPPVTIEVPNNTYRIANDPHWFQKLIGGTDDTLSDSDLQTELCADDVLASFDTKQIQLLCCPEMQNADGLKEITTKLLAYCENRGDCMFVGHTPNCEVDGAKAYGTDLQNDKTYGALYFPWIKVNDPHGKAIQIPPDGHVLGVYARTDRERGIWKAPAGNAANLRGVLDIAHHISDTTHTDLVKNGSVNAIRYIAGKGIVIDSSRTLSTNTLWVYVNVRLLFNFVKSSLKSGLRWVVQEPNDETLWNKVKYNSVTPFLSGLWRRGAFGPGAPEDVFTVKVDSENNMPADIQNGILNVEVYFYPSRPAETIIIKVGQQEGGASASES